MMRCSGIMWLTPIVEGMVGLLAERCVFAHCSFSCTALFSLSASAANSRFLTVYSCPHHTCTHMSHSPYVLQPSC